MALSTIGVDWLDTTGLAVVAVREVATNSRCIHSQEQRANIRITHPHCTSASKLELLPHSRWQHQKQAHQQDVCQIRLHAQSTCNEDQHDERVTRRALQDDSTFGLQLRAPRPVPVVSSCPCNLAEASSPRQLHHPYAADDASRTLPPDALHGAAVRTSTSSVLLPYPHHQWAQ